MSLQEEIKVKFQQPVRKTAIFFVLSVLFLFSGMAAWAQQPTPPVGASAGEQLLAGLSYAEATGLADADIRVIVAKIIRVFLGLLGIIAIGFIIYGGFMYMTSAGNEEKVTTAKRILKNMAIGLAIILSAYSIAQFVITSLYNSYYAQVTEGGGAAGEAGTAFYLGSAGLGTVIESHYPGRDATAIPRNTSIIITFKQKMVTATLTSGGLVNANNIKIFPSSLGQDSALKAEEVAATLSADAKTLVLSPKNPLGSLSANTNYTVRLTNDLKIDDGSPLGLPAFERLNGYYEWRFTVSTVIDVTPPTVTSVFPVASPPNHPINIVTRINFSEPVNPLTASGIFSLIDQTKKFSNLTVATNQPLPGEFKISNNYQTVEFIPANPCEQKNTCGQIIYCLPKTSEIKVTAKSATLFSPLLVNQPFKAQLLDGVVDMAGNALDGNKNNVPNGPGAGPTADNYSWIFRTSGTEDRSSPSIIDVQPEILQSNVRLDAPVKITFNKPMQISSLENLVFKTSHGPIWYFKTAENLSDNGQLVKTKVTINHAPLLPAVPPAVAPNYFPFIPQTVTDAYQNCFYPAADSFSSCSSSGREDAPNCYNGLKDPRRSLCADNEICPFGDQAIKN